MLQIAFTILLSCTLFGGVPGAEGFPTPIPKIDIIKALDLAKYALVRNFKKIKKFNADEMIPISIRYVSQEDVALSFPAHWGYIKQNLTNDEWLWIVGFANSKNRLFVRYFCVDQNGKAFSLYHWDITALVAAP